MSIFLESIPEADRAKYSAEYDEMECKNLSLAEYMTMQHEIKLNEIRDNAKYETLSVGLEEMNPVKIGENPPNNSIYRTIIIDGVNVMNEGSTYSDSRSDQPGAKIPDVAALLSIVRYFVVRNFEVIVMIPRKYTEVNATNYKSAMWDLVKNNVCMITPSGNQEDTICLDLAQQMNGVVVSSDKFEDLAKECERNQRIVNNNRLHIDWAEVNNLNQNTKTLEGDYVAGKKFGFYKDNGEEMTTEEVQEIIYANEKSFFYEVSRERYELSKPEKKKNKILAMLSNLIVNGLTICPETAEAIILAGPQPSASDEEEYAHLHHGQAHNDGSLDDASSSQPPSTGEHSSAEESDHAHRGQDYSDRSSNDF